MKRRLKKMTKDEEKVAEEQPKKEEVSERYSLAEVPTQTAIVIKDNDTEQVFSGETILLEILNKLNKIEKAVA